MQIKRLFRTPPAPLSLPMNIIMGSTPPCECHWEICSVLIAIIDNLMSVAYGFRTDIGLHNLHFHFSDVSTPFQIWLTINNSWWFITNSGDAIYDCSANIIYLHFNLFHSEYLHHVCLVHPVVVVGSSLSVLCDFVCIRVSFVDFDCYCFYSSFQILLCCCVLLQPCLWVQISRQAA